PIDTVEIERLPHFPGSKGHATKRRPNVSAHHVIRIAVTWPPAYQASGRWKTLVAGVCNIWADRVCIVVRNPDDVAKGVAEVNKYVLRGEGATKPIVSNDGYFAIPSLLCNESTIWLGSTV